MYLYVSYLYKEHQIRNIPQLQVTFIAYGINLEINASWLGTSFLAHNFIFKCYEVLISCNYLSHNSYTIEHDVCSLTLLTLILNV